VVCVWRRWAREAGKKKTFLSFFFLRGAPAATSRPAIERVGRPVTAGRSSERAPCVCASRARVFWRECVGVSVLETRVCHWVGRREESTEMILPFFCLYVRERENENNETKSTAR